ncbi:WD40 repeat domain-containing protein [Kitasatospora sp. NPDC056184]|uniref:WD40 repeat domain-containing protein n=1 Tax=Kitasatospora sp. NPDC056184 TaxID=3345738 RepID=UPI0035D9E062
MSRVRARALTLILLCLAAVGVGIGVARWQSDDPPATVPPTAADSGPTGNGPDEARYTLTEVSLPGGAEGRITASAALGEDLVLVGTSEGSVYYVDPARPGTAKLMTTTFGAVRRIRVSADGGTAAVLSQEGALRVMNLSRSTPTDLDIVPTEGPGGLSPHGDLLVFGSFDLTVLDVVSGRTSTLPAKPIPDGGRTAYEDWAVTGDGLVRAAGVDGVETWDPADPDRAGETIGCGCDARSVTFTGDGSLATFGTADGHVVVVDLATGRVIADKTIAVGDFTLIWTVAAFADGRRAAGGISSRAVIWDVGARRTVWDHTFPGYRVAEVGAVPNSKALLIRTVEEDASAEAGDPADDKVWIATPAL